MVRSLIGSWVTAWREQYSCVGACHSSSSASAWASMSGSRSPTSISARSDRSAAAKNALNARSSTSTARSSRGMRREVEVVVLRDGSRARACAGRLVGRAFAAREVARVVAQGAEQRRRWNCSARAAHHGIRIAPSARIHGGVVSSPHSHGWMSVISGDRRVALAEQPSVVREDLGGELGDERSPSLSGSAAATRSTAIATSGGWVMHVGRDVARRAGVASRPPHPSTPDVTRAVGEDHVREHPVRPLTAEQRAQLAGRRGPGRSGRCRWR